MKMVVFHLGFDDWQGANGGMKLVLVSGTIVARVSRPASFEIEGRMYTEYGPGPAKSLYTMSLRVNG